MPSSGEWLNLDLFPGVSIREAEASDAPFIASIYNEAIRKGGSTMDTVEKSAAEILAQMEAFNHRETILILERYGEVLGWGMIKAYGGDPGYRVACESSVYFRQREVRKGYGTLIKKAIIGRCKLYGYHHMVARITADNQASIAYCERHGYELVGRQREIGFSQGRWHDVVIMQLLLDDVGPPGPGPR